MQGFSNRGHANSLPDREQVHLCLQYNGARRISIWFRQKVRRRKALPWGWWDVRECEHWINGETGRNAAKLRAARQTIGDWFQGYDWDFLEYLHSRVCSSCPLVHLQALHPDGSDVFRFVELFKDDQMHRGLLFVLHSCIHVLDCHCGSHSLGCFRSLS